MGSVKSTHKESVAKGQRYKRWRREADRAWNEGRCEYVVKFKGDPVYVYEGISRAQLAKEILDGR